MATHWKHLKLANSSITAGCPVWDSETGTAPTTIAEIIFSGPPIDGLISSRLDLAKRMFIDAIPIALDKIATVTQIMAFYQPDVADFEAKLEAAYWNYDTRKAGTGEYYDNAHSDRDAFKTAVRRLVADLKLTKHLP